jgi:PRTRC genetic system protein F
MQTTSTEILAITFGAPTETIPPLQLTSNQHLFLLPTVSPEIPLETGARFNDTGLSALARQLFDSGILLPEDVSDDAKSVQQIVDMAISAWIQKRVPALNNMLLSIELLRPETVVEIVSDCVDPDGYLHEEAPFIASENYSIAIRGSFDYLILELQSKARVLEASVPGLFQTALHAIQLATDITVDIHMPSHFLNEYFQLWEFWDEKGIPSDEGARESLIGHFGDDAPEVDDQVPSRILPMLGGSLCLHELYGTKFINRRELKKLVRSVTDADVTLVAQLTLDLLDSIREAEKINACLPKLSPYNNRFYEKGCTLVFEFNPIINAQIDDEFQTTMAYGNGTEYLGIEPLPSSSDDLIAFFKRLDLALAVLADMDNLIGLIAQTTD